MAKEPNAATMSTVAATFGAAGFRLAFESAFESWALQEGLSHDYIGIYLHEHDNWAFDGICMESLPFPQPTSAFRVFPLTSGWPFGGVFRLWRANCGSYRRRGRRRVCRDCGGLCLIGFSPFFGLRGIAQWIEHSHLHAPQAKTPATFPKGNQTPALHD